jgi:hypothetical protein
MTDPDFLKRVREMARKKQAALGAGLGASGQGGAGHGGAGQGEAGHGAAGHGESGQGEAGHVEAGQGAAGHATVGQFGQTSGSMMGEPSFDPCCEGKVHIAYRGVSDDKMYISHDRKFSEIKYFRPNGLRVFCAGCRRRLN